MGQIDDYGPLPVRPDRATAQEVGTGDWGDDVLTSDIAVDRALRRLLTPEDHAAGGIAVLLCDAAGHLLLPMFIEPFPVRTSPGVRRRALEWVTALCAHSSGAGGRVGSTLVLAVVHGPEPQPEAELAWHAATAAACDRSGVRLLGTYAVAGSTVTRLPGRVSAA